MPAIGTARTKIERDADSTAWRLRSQLATELRQAREDAGLSQRRLAAAAGVSHSTVHALERGTYDPTTAVVARLATALGSTLYVRIYPGTGPLIRDHAQAAMVSALLGTLGPRWQPTPEVAVYRPVRGVIDLVLEAPHPPLVACEAQSELRRLEQLMRWTQAKADALAEGRETPVSRLLLLRSTRLTRAVAAEHAGLIAAAYPARCMDVHTALTGTADWPGDGILWCHLDGGSAEIMDRPPRGIRLGR